MAQATAQRFVSTTLEGQDHVYFGARHQHMVKNHPTTTMEIKLNGFTIIAHGDATIPFNTKSYTSFIAVLYPELLTGED